MTSSSSSSESKILIFKSFDGEEFHVEESSAVQSITIKELIKDCTDRIVPLVNIEGRILAKCIVYLNKLAKAKTPSTSDEDADMVEFNEKFFEEDADDKNTIFDLIKAAKFLNTMPLLDLLYTKVLDMINGYTPEQIRQLFNIKNDFTPEEDEKVKRENAWVFK